jgi:hypothetical protein
MMVNREKKAFLLLACTVLTPRVPPFVPWIAFTQPRMALSYMTKTYVSAVVIVFMPAPLVPPNSHKTASLAHAEKWISVLFVRAGLNLITVMLNLITMAAIDWQKENSHCALKCVQPRPY